MSTFISYSDLSKAILNCKLPSKETLNILSQNQQIELLKFFYNKQQKLLNKLLEHKKNEQMPINIPNIRLPKRDKTKPSKLKLSELCTWLPKNYFSKIKSDFTPLLDENNIKESITWLQLGYTAREKCLKQKLVDRADNFRRRNKKANLKVINSNMQAASEDELETLQQNNRNIEENNRINEENILESDIEECTINKENIFGPNIELDEYYQENTTINEYNNEEPFATSSSNSFVTSTSNNNIVTSRNYELYDSTSDMAFDTTFSSDEELSRNISSQPYKHTLKTNTPIMKTTDRISNRTRQKYHINSEDSLPKRIQKKDTLQSSTLANETRKIQRTNIN
ncbi:25003_t:CDS:2, partial [Cetraspora pellucida]